MYTSSHLFRRVEYRGKRRGTFRFKPCECAKPSRYMYWEKKSQNICKRCHGAILNKHEIEFLRAPKLGTTREPGEDDQ